MARWWLAALACLLMASPSRAWRVEVLDLVVLPAVWQAHELSDLAWRPDDRALMAVSDRGQLWRLPVTWHGEPGHERLRLGPASAPMPLRADIGGVRPNAEALAWRPPRADAPDGAWLVADERGHRVLVFDVLGRWLGSRAVPGPGDARSRLRHRNAGIEALAWLPAHGVVAATQRPLDDDDAAPHRLQADDGRWWALPAAGRRSSVKAMTAWDDSTLLVLERVQQGQAWQAQLRPVSLERCGAGQACDAPVLPLVHTALADRDNVEGVACVGAGLCLLVSDDGGQGRTVLLLVRLQR